MNGYKFRGGSDDIFERDLAALENNFIWAPNYIDLNDPCETLMFSDSVEEQIKMLESLLKHSAADLEQLKVTLNSLLERRKVLGIYSLSTTHTHELLWAHYAGSHRGFCVGYDLNILAKQNEYHELYLLPVSYSKKPPSINLRDVSNSDNLRLLKKMAGTKSPVWAYEKEVRILSDTVGQNYHDFSAITDIYFGFRMPENHKIELMHQLSGRGIKYHQMLLNDRSYRFSSRPISDPNSGAFKYIGEHEVDDDVLKYEIIEQSYSRYPKKGVITVLLPEKISKSTISSLSLSLKQKLFVGAERVFVSYYVKGMPTNDVYWATTSFYGENFETKILGLTNEQESFLVKSLEMETGEILGQWLDETPFVSSAMTLFQDADDIILKTLYVDGSSSSKNMRLSTVEDGTKLEEVEKNHHGEYCIISHNGDLLFLSPDGVFRKAKPFGVPDTTK